MTASKSAPASGTRLPSRREFIEAVTATAAVLVLPMGAASAAASQDCALVIHKGWVLRADDLPRLAGA